MPETLDSSRPATLQAETAAHPRTGWVSAIALTAAAVCVGYAIQVRDGEYWPTAIHKIGVAIFLCAVGVAFPRVRQFRWSGGAVLVALWAAVLFQFYLLLSASPGSPNWWNNDIRYPSGGSFLLYYVVIGAAGLLVLMALRVDRRWGRWLFALVLAA